MQVSDYATLLEAIHNGSALATHLAQRKILTGPSAEFCQVEDCAMSIPDERRRAIPGIQFCTQCQTRRERSPRR